MAHFAELDKDNKVIRVVVACNQDIANNGGEQSEQAAKHFETVCPFSQNGVKWVQTSYNHNFRKQYAGKDFYYDENKNIFIRPQPFASWSLDVNSDWQSPVVYPTITTYGDNLPYFISWNENELKWTAKDNQNNEFYWIPSSFSWVATGN
jgi:hypothetical protein